MFQATALALGSDRGQWGLLVAAAVVGSLLIAERMLFAGTLRTAWESLGLRTPRGRGVAAAVPFAIVWMAAGAVVPWAAFLVTRGVRTRSPVRR